MAKKTWKIGEYCKGGIISVDVKESDVILYLKEWDYSTGSNAKSNQSGAKVLEKVNVNLKEVDNYWGSRGMSYIKIEEILNDWTTSYYADQIMTWIKKTITGAI